MSTSQMRAVGNRCISLLALLGILAGFTTTAAAQPDEWPLVVVEGHFTFPLPPTLELAEGTFESATRNGHEVLVITAKDLGVWAQPKGLNDLGEDAARARTAGIVINTERGAAGDYWPLGADMSMTTDELHQLDERLHTQFAKSGGETGQITDLSWGGTDVVQIEGTQAIRLRYTAKMGPAGLSFAVNTYMVQNYDSMYYVTATYTLDEKAKWMADLETALNGLRFETRGE